MEAFKIITNTTADLPMDYIKENQLGLIYFNYIMDEVSYGKDKELEWKEFYRLMREEGKMPTTSQVNPQQYKEYFEVFLKENACSRRIDGGKGRLPHYRGGFKMRFNGRGVVCP